MPKRKEHTHEHDRQELQSKYIQLQVFKQQLQAYAQEKQAIDERMSELNMTIEAIHGLEKIGGSEMWSSLGSGSFVRSDVKDTQKVMISIGAGIVVGETRERAIVLLKERLEELSTLSTEVMTEATKISHAISRLEPEVERLAEHIQHE